MTREELKQIHDALSLLNSMVNGGEQHSPTSINITQTAFAILRQTLPPADATAEAFVRAKIADNKLHDCYPTFVPEMTQMLTEFAAQRQPQPTDEETRQCPDCNGDGQILHDYEHGEISKCYRCDGSGTLR